MSLRTVFVIAAVAIILPAASLMAQQNSAETEAVKAQIQSNRQALMAENLMLSESESADFWPVYQDFHAERDALLDRRINLLQEFRDNFDALDDAQATRMLDDYFALENDFLELRQEYLPKFRRVLSDKQTLRYYQIENKMDLIIEYELSQVLPLAQ
jgi:hypothetical protein